MVIREQSSKTIGDMAAEALAKTFGRTHFKDRETRDAVAERVMKDHGVRLKKSSSRGIELHPEYVTDYVGRIESGFGNTQYQTYWTHMYNLEHERRD